MNRFRPQKPRVYGSLHEVISRAVDQLGGLDKAASVIDRGRDWLYTATNSDREKSKAANLSLQEARTMCGHGATALAEDMAFLAGGIFLPPAPDAAPAAIHAALSKYALESGEAIGLIIARVADGVFDVADAQVALKEIDEALRPLMTLRALAASVIETGEAVR